MESCHSVVIYEGDAILLSVKEKTYFVHSFPPIRKSLPNEKGPVDIDAELSRELLTDDLQESLDRFPFNLAGLYPISYDEATKRPILPNVNFMSFKVLPEHALDSKTESKDETLPTKLVYGQKIKLLHVASKTYLSLPAAQYTCGNTSFATLKAPADESCFFFFQPLWKGKKIGEPVCSEDEILLESVKYRGDFVIPVDDRLSGRVDSLSARVDHYPLLLSRSHQPDTSYYKSGFVIHVHNSTNVKSQLENSTDVKLKLEGGSVIRLSNTIESGYLCGGGSTALAGHNLRENLRRRRESAELLSVGCVADVLNPYLEHCREPTVGCKMQARKELHLSTVYKPASVSGARYWLLEKWENPLDGSSFKFGESCCLRHLPTHRYLAVKKGTNDNFELITVDGKNNEDYIYQFVIESLDGSSGKFVPSKTDAVLRIAYDSDHDHDPDYDPGHDPDHAPDHVPDYAPPGYLSLDITRSQSTKAGDKLFLIKPSRKQSIVRIKKVDFTKRVYDAYFVDSIKNVLMTLNMFMQRYPDRPVPVHYLYVLDAVANWLKESSYMKKKTRTKLLRTNHVIDLLVSCLTWREMPPQNLGLEVCYVLEWFVKVPSKLSHLYFVAKSEGKKSLLDVLIGLLGKGINVVKVLTPLVQSKSPAAKHVIKKLLDTKFIPEHLTITIDTMEFFSALCFINDVPFKKMQDYICDKIRPKKFEQCTSEEEALQVAQIVHKRNHENEDFKKWVAQLKLFSSICKGSNGKSINFTKHIVPFDTACTNALIGIHAGDIHPVFKSAYLEFLVSAYVDPVIDSSGSTIDDIWHLYSKDTLETKDQPLDGAGLKLDLLNSLKSSNKEQIKHLIETMNNVIGTNSVLTVVSQDGRNSITFLCDVMAAMKVLISYGYSWNVGDQVHLRLRPLIDILNGSSDEYPHNVECSSYVIERYKFRKKYVHLFKLKTRVIELLHIYLKQLIYLALEQFMFSFARGQYTEDQWQHPPTLNRLFFPYKGKPFDLLYEYRWFDTSNSDGQKLVRILQDLMLYGDDKLRAASAGLLSAMYNKEQTMLEDAEFSYIACDADEAYRHSITFGTFADSTEDDNPTLSSLIQGTTSESASGKVWSLLDLMVGILTMKNNEQDETRGSRRMQNITFTSGIFSIFLSYVLKYCVQSDLPELQTITERSGVSVSAPDIDDDSQLERLNITCKCLQMMCRGNTRIKCKISKKFTEFLHVESAVFSVACLLTEVLTNNREVCKNIKKSDIKQLYFLAISRYLENPDYLEFFTTLQALMKPSKSSAESCIAVHQHYVARLFLDTHKDYFCEFMTIEKQAERQELLCISPDTDDDNKTKLLILLHLTSLLATCCEGQSRFAEEICLSIFTFEEILDILISVEIPPVRKVPFARLLAGVYLSNDKNLITMLSGNDQFWNYVDGFIRATRNNLKQHSDPNEMTVHLRKLLTLHLSWSEVISDRDELKGALQYLVEGLGPLVTVFYDKIETNFENGEIADDRRAFTKEIVQEIGNLIMNQLTGNSIQGCELKWLEECCLQVVTSYEHAMYEDEFKLNSQFQMVVSRFKNRLKLTITEDEERLFTEEVVRQAPDGLRNMQLLKLFRRRTDSNSCQGIACFKASVMETLRLCEMLGSQMKKLNHLTFSELAVMQQTIDVILEMFGVLHACIIESKAYDRESLKELQNEVIDTPFVDYAKSLLASERRNVAIHVFAFFCVIHYNNNDEEKIYSLITEDVSFFHEMERLIKCVHVAFNQVVRKKEHADERMLLDVHIESSEMHIQHQSIDQTDAGVMESSALLQTFPIPVRIDRPCRALEQDEDYQPEKEQEDALFLVNAALDAILILCYGQNRKIQRVLGVPNRQSLNKTDFVREVAVLLQTLVRIPGSWKTLIACKSKAIQALIEMCSGNAVNQWAAMEGQAVDSINHILINGLNLKALSMQSRAIKLLDVLLQQTAAEISSHIVMLVLRDLDITCLVKFMIDVYTKYEEELKKLVYIPNGTDADEETIIKRNLFRAYHILRSLADHKKKTFASFLNEFTKCPKDEPGGESLYKRYRHIWDYLYEHTRSIELNYYSEHDKKNMLVRVYFPFHSSQTFTEEEKSVFQAKVNRDELEDKHKDMLNWTVSALNNNVHKARLGQIPLVFPLLLGFSSQIRRWLLVFLTLALNACVLALFIVPDSVIKEQERNPSLVFISNPHLRWPAYLYYILAYPYIILSLWMVLEYFIVEWPNFVFLTSNMRMAVFQLEVWIKRNVRYLYNPIRRAHNRKFPDEKDKDYIFELPVYYQCFDIDFFGLRPLYRIVFLISAVLGAISINFGYVYCLCLPYVFIYNLEMQNIINAVSNKAWQLISFTGVILAILWFYTVISFAFLYNFFDESQSLYCTSLLQCFVTVVRDGLLSSYGGAIPVTYVNQPHPDFGIFVWRAIIDISFYFSITLIVFPIIISIFSDSFNELRDKMNKMLKDQQSVCFICGIENDRFERDIEAADVKGSAFYEHTHYDHYVYSYIYYGIYVQRKLTKLHSTFEDYVYNKINEKKFDFYPKEEAMSIGKKDKET